METEPDARPESPPVQVDGRALMDIATNLPRYDRVDDIEAVGIFAELLEALQAYLTSAAPSLDKHDQPRLGATSHSERSQDKSWQARKVRRDEHVPGTSRWI
jgi:hypothetical protein